MPNGCFGQNLQKRFKTEKWTSLQNYITYFRSKKGKNENHHPIPRVELHRRISLTTKFQHKLVIFIFWAKFAQKRYSQSKTDKINISIKFSIFELVWIELNWTVRERYPYLGFSGPHFLALGLNTGYLSVFSPNARKYGPEKLGIQTLFTQWNWITLFHIDKKHIQSF